ncbi:helix-turn-helix transcriptional regulator [Clostridium sp. HBUAS56017]|nr:helix-turn-helix transcriptional regulator [Clostridium sp. HBUAS56017]
MTKWEADRGMPDIENIQNISKLFGVSIDYLLDDE